MTTAKKTTRSAQRDELAATEDGKLSEAATLQVEAFRELAASNAAAPFPVLPTTLDGHARRRFVRTTIQEDHRSRIREHNHQAMTKFDKLAGSVFSFLRGTALLFYRDMVGTDATMPTVLALGDVHPENFGIMPDANNVPIFGVNDFDEVYYAPFTWDLKRGAVTFMIAAEEIGGHGPTKQRAVVAKFLRGYVEAMDRYAEHSTEANEQFLMHNSPPLIQALFDDAMEDRKEWLWDDYLEGNGRGFKASKKLTPLSERTSDFQRHLRGMMKKSGRDIPARAGDLTVKDVAIRHSQGTASLGLPRYYVLVEGPSKNATDDLIIEFKRARQSALEGLVPPNDYATSGEGDRIAHGQSVQLAHGDVFYGHVEIDGESFMTRERAPFRDDIDLEDLSGKEWKAYASVCGAALAQAHALSDDLGSIDYDVEPAIVDAMRPFDLFVDDMVEFATETAARVRRDHEGFCRDLELGAFENIEQAYR